MGQIQHHRFGLRSPHVFRKAGNGWFRERLSLIRSRLLMLFYQAKDSFWFIPATLCVSMIALALLMSWVDIRVQDWIARDARAMISSVDSARQILASIGAAMITVAGVVYSITIATLSVASSQFGPRLLKNFMRRRTTQFALGLFLATGLYALIVLYVTRGEPARFVPSLSTFVALILMIICLGTLIFFMHDTAVSIQAPEVITSVAREIHGVIDQLYPVDPHGAPGPVASEIAVRERLSALGDNYTAITANFEGYLLNVDEESLRVIAEQRDLTMRLLVREGRFVTPGFPLIDIWPSQRVDASLRDVAMNAFTHGGRPTPFADMEAALNELVQLALRALSPALNDPLTGINCVDRIGAALAEVAARPIPPSFLCDERMCPRVLFRPFTFAELLNIAISPIRQSGSMSPPVMIRMLEALGLMAARAARDTDRIEIKFHAELILRSCERTFAEPADLEIARDRFERLLAVLATRPSQITPATAEAETEELDCAGFRALLGEQENPPRDQKAA